MPARELERPRSGRAVVWAESPLQLLSAIEGHSAGLLGRETIIYPRAAIGVSSTADSLTPQVPEGVRVAQAGTRIPSARTSGVARWVIGDAYSGLAQRQLLRDTSANEVVILDDGLATLQLLRSLTADHPHPLVRPRTKATAMRSALGFAAWHRLSRLTRQGRLLVFTALTVEESVRERFAGLGGLLEGHRFEWLATRPVTEYVDEPTIVVGSAMPADGLVHVEPYIQWVHSLTEDGPVGYYPHRRESAALRSRIGEHPMVRMKEHTVPVEMRFRGLRPEQTVHCLPSTVFASLSLILASTGVPLKGHHVPEDWWTPTTAASLRSHLSDSLAFSRETT